MAALNQPLVGTIIEQELSTSRFESFCNALVSEVEGGRPIVGTSPSWDMGRDGRALAGNAVFVCASLSDDVDEKAERDIKRLSSKRAKPCALYFCSNQKLSELRCDAIEEQLQKFIPAGSSIYVLGQQQLSELSLKHSGPFLKSYASEWRDCLMALREDGVSDTETEGFRLALVTSQGENTFAVRQGLYRALILSAIGPRETRTVGHIATLVSNDLGLARALGVDALVPHVNEMLRTHFLAEGKDGLSLTETGRGELRRNEEEAAKRLVEGRAIIRKALEAELGFALADDHFDRIWGIFREKIAHAFYMRGVSLLVAISTLIGQNAASKVRTEKNVMAVSELFEQIGNAVAQTTHHEAQKEELRLATHDILTDQTGPAFEWLVGVSVSYVALCSLGVESSSRAAIADVLGRTSLILDTDIALSLLGEGEPEHEAVTIIARRWKRFGGTILVGDPVLREVAWHAAIAEYDYRENQSWLPGSPYDRLRYIDNVFVRGFAELLAQGRAHRGQWKSYVSQFTGGSKYNWDRVLDALQQDYNIARLPPATSKERELQERARLFLREAAGRRTSGEALSRALDKADRDSELYAAMIRYMRARRTEEAGAICFLVSSAKRLVDVEEELQATGEERVVVPLSVILHLLSLAPEVTVSLRSMGTFLFDEKAPRFSNDMERMLLRVVRGSKEVDMPWAKRAALVRLVRARLIDEADARIAAESGPRGLARAAAKMVKEREAESIVVESLKGALDSLALDTKTEKENAALRKTVAALREEVEQLKSERR